MFKLNAISTLLASVGMLSVAGSVYAQQAERQAPPAYSSEIQEISVTAQKRVQSSSKVPASLSVISTDDIKEKGISTAANLTELVPNVQIGTGSAGGMEITIRGIGNADNTERGDPQAAFHVDGIYIGRPQGAGATFFDLERVEVLRGPQGTLYGRNANAGAINVISRKPTDKFESSVGVEVGNYKGRKIDAMVNAPVNEALSLRAVVSSQAHSGYSDTANAANGFSRNRDDQDNTSGRLQGLVKFSPTASLLLGFDTSKDKGAGAAYFDITNGVLPTTRQQNPQVEGRINNNTQGFKSELKVGLGAADLVYLYGHRTASRDEVGSFGSGPSVYNLFSSSYKQDSHEVRLSSNGADSLQWVGGAYMFKEVGRNIDLDALLPAAFGGGRAIHFVQDPAINESKAVFGQATYAFTPVTRVTSGLRTTNDLKSRTGETRVGPMDTPIGAVGNNASGSWNKLTYRLGVEHDLNATQMTYATLSTGYKAGGFNDGNAVVGDPNYNSSLYYKPESIKSLETGVKGRFLDNKLQLSAGAFFYDYTNLQKSGVINNSTLTINTGKASVKGLEFEGRAAVSAAGRINFALGLLSARYDIYTTPNGQNFSGQSLDRAPKETLTLGYTHNFGLSSGANLSAYLGARYTSSFILSDTGTATQAARIFTQSATTKSDFTMTYSSPNDSYSVQGFVKNIENKSSLASIFTVNSQNVATLSEPRTLGLRANYKF